MEFLKDSKLLDGRVQATACEGSLCQHWLLVLLLLLWCWVGAMRFLCLRGVCGDDGLRAMEVKLSH